MSALNAAALASLTSWIEDKLGDEHADRQTICEDVAAQLRDMAAALRESAPPGPPSRQEYTEAAGSAIQGAAIAEHDFGGWLAEVLSRAAAGLGSSALLVQGRPGSWEAAHVLGLVRGTVGHGDEYLADYRPGGAR